MALQIQSRLLACRAVRERNVVVGDFIPEVDFILGKQDTSSDGVYGCITPSFVEETALAVKGFEIVKVLLRPEPVQASDFKVRPLDLLAIEHADETKSTLTK